MKRPKLHVDNYTGPYLTSDARVDYDILMTRIGIELNGCRTAIMQLVDDTAKIMNTNAELRAQLRTLRISFTVAGMGVFAGTVATWAWMLVR